MRKLTERTLRRLIREEIKLLREQDNHYISVNRAMKLLSIFNKKMGLNINPSKLKEGPSVSDFFYADYTKEIRKVLPKKMADALFQSVSLQIESDNNGDGTFEIQFSFLVGLTNSRFFGTLVAEMVVDENDNVISFTKGRNPFSLDI